MPQPDVFISYSHRDKAWVEDILLPRLRASQLNICQDVAQFRAGASCIANMEAAVAGCRRTLAVLTPAWVASDWCNLESHLTLLEDPIGVRRRLVPILVEPCTPSATVRLLTHLDFTKPEHAEDNWSKLLADLSTQVNASTLSQHEMEQRPAERAAKRFSTGVDALIHAMANNASLRAAVATSEVCLRLVRNNLVPLRFWKEVHDQLHQVERTCYLPLTKIKKKLTEFETIESLTHCRTNLSNAVGKLHIIFARIPVLAQHCTWFTRLVLSAARAQEEAVKYLSQAQFAQAASELDSALEKLQRALAQMPGLEEKIRTHAELLPATDLRDALEDICAEWERLQLDESGLVRFREASDAIYYLCTGLLWMRADHTAWQQVDAEFRLSDPQLEVAMLRADTGGGLPIEDARIEAYAAYVDRSWESAAPLFEPIVADPRHPAAAEVSRQVAEMNAAIVQRRSAWAGGRPSDAVLLATARMLQIRYHDLRSRCGERFFLADCDLNEFAKNFAEIGAPIDAILSFLNRP